MFHRFFQPGAEQTASGRLGALPYALSLPRDTLRRSSATEAQRWGHRVSPNKWGGHHRSSSSSSGGGLQGQKITKYFVRNFDANEEAELEEEVAAFAAQLKARVGGCCSGQPTLAGQRWKSNGVLLPTSPFLKSWTVVLFVLIGWTALVTPFQVCLQLELPPRGQC
jgi:hypothetical protein